MIYGSGLRSEFANFDHGAPYAVVNLEHFPLMLMRSLRVGGNWRILPDKQCEGANEFCARGRVLFAQPLFATVL